MMPRIHWAWVILLASFATVFVHYSVRLGYGILMPEMILSLKISKAQAGAIYSSFSLAYCLFAPLLGYLVDRFNARLLLAVFPGLMAAGTFFMGKPQTLFQACLAFSLVGVGASALWTPVVTVVQRWFGARRRGMALGILSIGYAVGYGIMGFALPPLVAAYGWRTCWLVLAGAAALLVPLNGLLLRSRPGDLGLRPWGDPPGTLPPPAGEPGPQAFSYRALLKMPGLYYAGVSYFFIGFTAYVVALFIVTYGALELKFPFPQAARLASAIAFSGIPGALLLPLLSDSIGRKKCLLIIIGGMSASLVLIILAGDSWPALVAAVSFYGVCYAAVWPLYAAAAADFFPLQATGSVLGLWTIFYGLALILAPAVAGWIADWTGTFVYSFLTGVASGILAALFLLPVRKQPGGGSP